MIISIELYERLRLHVENRLRHNSPVTIEDAIHFEVPFDCLSSLYSQVSLRFGSQFSKGSYTYAKNYLENKFGRDFKVATFLENPSLVTQSEERHDLLRMIADDLNNSVEANLIKESTGKDYEDLLVELLNSRKMCFETEEESRAKGKPKTPDVLFLVPMATTKGRYDSSDFATSASGIVSIGSSNAGTAGVKRSPTKRSTSTTIQSTTLQSDDYLVINWIDSKAMFADRKTFNDHMIQLESYRNRYGRGMVIYWHGVVEDVYSLLNDDMIVIRDCFPEEWIFPTGESADGRVPMFDMQSIYDTTVNSS